MGVLEGETGSREAGFQRRYPPKGIMLPGVGTGVSEATGGAAEQPGIGKNTEKCTENYTIPTKNRKIPGAAAPPRGFYLTNFILIR